MNKSIPDENVGDAWKDFNKVEQLPEDERLREWLKRYSNKGLRYAISFNEKIQGEWQDNYKDSKFEPRINLIERLPNECIIECDGDKDKAQESFNAIEKFIKKNGWGYILSSHKGKSDYIWLQFKKTIKDDTLKSFLQWVFVKSEAYKISGSAIDLNFSSSIRTFPVMYNYHRKHSSNKELPVYFRPGDKVVIEKWMMNEFEDVKKSLERKTEKQKDGFEYETASKSNNSDRGKFLLSKEKPKFQSLGIGTFDSFFYFGTKVYDGNTGINAVITSDKKLYVAYKDNNEIRQRGINYRFDFNDSILDYQWSNNGSDYSISEFLFGKPKIVSIKECFQDSYKKNKDYMDYPEDIIHVSIACDIESSYYLPLFEAKGRGFINAEKGSGKTKQSTLYQLQMFNPVMSSDMTGASMFRAIESTSCSIIIDDFDLLDEEKKQMNTQIIRAGYKQGQKSIRAGEDKNRTPSSFNIFSSMIINNVGGLDEITQDRCNTYYLIKSTDKRKSNKKLNVKDKNWQVERDKRYYSALQNWELVRDVYQSLDIGELKGRDFEKIAPILTIGKIVLDDAKYKELEKFELDRISEHKVRDVSDDWCFQAIKYVINNYNTHPIISMPKFIELQLDTIVKGIIDIPEFITYGDNEVQNKEYPKRKHGISVFLGKIFKNTPLFKSSFVHGGFVKYTFKPDAILKFLEIRGYKEFFKENDLSPLQSIQPHQSNQSNQPIQSIQSIHEQNSGEVGEVGEIERVGYPEQPDVVVCARCGTQENVNSVISSKNYCKQCAYEVSK